MISTAQLSMGNCSGLARGPTAASEPCRERWLSRESSQSSAGKRDVMKCPEQPLPLPLEGEEEEEEAGWGLTDHLSSAEQRSQGLHALLLL